MSTQNFHSFATGLVSTLTASFLFCTHVYADPVWHCSRTDVQVADAANNFSLAALDVEREVMHVSLRDVYSIYQGNLVKASGVVVSACFIGGNHPMTQAAMKSIGATPLTLEKLSSKSAIARSHVYMVHNEQDMLACMTQHYPAIGYFPKATHTEAVGPCF